MFAAFASNMHRETFFYISFLAGIYSSYFMRGIIKSLTDMQNLPDESFPFRKQVVCLFVKIIFDSF